VVAVASCELKMHDLQHGKKPLHANRPPHKNFKTEIVFFPSQAIYARFARLQPEHFYSSLQTVYFWEMEEYFLLLA
jgi:hypothetical protein